MKARVRDDVLKEKAIEKARATAATVAASLKSGDFGEALRDYSWEAQSSEYDTNGLLQVDIVVTKRGSREPVDTMTILVYQANAKSSAFGAPRFR